MFAMLMIKLPFTCVLLLKESGKCLKSVQVFCGHSYKTTWNSHTTPNYEKTFNAVNQGRQ